MTSDELELGCVAAFSKPLQPLLIALGIPRETRYGPLFKSILTQIAKYAESATYTPTGWTVRSEVMLTSHQCAELEAELGRKLCKSGDVLFGSIQIVACELKDDDYEPDLLARRAIDLRTVYLEGECSCAHS